MSPLSNVWMFQSWASPWALPQPLWIHRGYTDGVACWGPPSHTALPVEHSDEKSHPIHLLSTCCQAHCLVELELIDIGRKIPEYMYNYYRYLEWRLSVRVTREHTSITSSLLETFWPPHPPSFIALSFGTPVGSALASSSSSFNIICEQSYLKISANVEYIFA